jgi:hypothetical protein
MVWGSIATGIQQLKASLSNWKKIQKRTQNARKATF